MTRWGYLALVLVAVSFGAACWAHTHADQIPGEKIPIHWNIRGEPFPGKRLHVRAIVRDGQRAFIGSQSLRRLELENRREIGVIITDGSVVRQLQQFFALDWSKTDAGRREAKKAAKADKKKEKLAAAS